MNKRGEGIRSKKDGGEDLNLTLEGMRRERKRMKDALTRIGAERRRFSFVTKQLLSQACLARLTSTQGLKIVLAIGVFDVLFLLFFFLLLVLMYFTFYSPCTMVVNTFLFLLLDLIN